MTGVHIIKIIKNGEVSERKIFQIEAFDIKNSSWLHKKLYDYLCSFKHGDKIIIETELEE